MNWFNSIYHIGYVIITLMLIDMIVVGILAKVTGKKFDRLLADRGISYPISVNFFAPFNWGRTSLYAGFILFFKNPVSQTSLRYRNYKKRFGNFYFRQYASKADIFLSVIHILLLMLTMIAIIYLFYMGSK